MACLRFLLLALAAVAMPAAAAELRVSGVWDGDRGLPHPVVTAVEQSRLGDLWCGTYYGLARFDGTRFAIFDERNCDVMGSSAVTAIRELGEAGLWVGLANGELVRVARREPVDRVSPEDRGRGEVVAIELDAAGDVWALWRDRVLMRLRDGLRFPIGEDLGSWPEVDLVRDREGRLWLIHRHGFAEVLEGGLRQVPLGIRERGEEIQRATASARGGLWVVVAGRLQRWADGGWVEELGLGGWLVADDPDTDRFATVMRELSDGRLIVGMVEGGVSIGRPEGPWQTITTAAGLPNEWVRCATEDHEGNLWLGTGGGGLAALGVARVRMVEVERGPVRHNLRSVAAAAGGGLWVATEGGGVWHLDHLPEPGERPHFQRVDGDFSKYVWSVVEDPRGRAWLGTWGGELRVGGVDGFRPVEGWPVDRTPIRVVLADSQGRIWAGGDGELGCLEDGVWRWRDEFGSPLTPLGQEVIVEDERGRVWVGCEDGRVVCRDGENTRIFGREHGLTGNAVEAIVPCGDDGAWLGTMGGGLVRLRHGRAVAVSEEHGLPSRIVPQLLADDGGFLWVGTADGICRIDRGELEACLEGRLARISPLTLGRSDGMATNGCSSGGQPGACRTADGRLWFTTARGLAVVRPDEIERNALPPPVVIESLTVDGESRPWQGQPLELEAGTLSCAIHYTALSLTAPEKVRFRTRLEGVEKDWQEVGRERTSVFRYLQPGDYRFHVIACNGDGVWNQVGASLPFRIRAHYWQQPWFRVLGVVLSASLVGLLVWLASRRRAIERLAEVERGHALERERARIARDIHDDLGSGLTRIMLLSQTVRDEVGEESPMRAELDQVSAAAERLTQAMDEIVWAVDPRHDSLESLMDYVMSAAQEFLSAAGTRCRIEAPSHPPDWVLSAECRHSLFLAFKEALHNVVRHAGAETVRIRFEIGERSFTLSVEDDGRGFEPGRAGGRENGGRGLGHLAERLAEVGGECRVESGPGSGTRVLFRVPVDRWGISSRAAAADS